MPLTPPHATPSLRLVINGRTWHLWPDPRRGVASDTGADKAPEGSPAASSHGGA